MLTLIKKENAEAVLVALLRGLKANISTRLITAELEKHPEYPSLLAISDVLRNFGIQNQAFTTGPNDLEAIPCPFIIHTTLGDGDFLLVNETALDKVFVSNETWRRHKMDMHALKQIFTGVVLTAELPAVPAKHMSPPVFDKFKVPLMLAGSFITLLFAFVINHSFLSNLNFRLASLAAVKTAGLFATLLLLVQSIDADNPFLQKLCQVGDKGDCRAILFSPAANAFKGLSWSEVGFFYFFGTWLITLFGDHSEPLMQSLALLNVIGLPYTVYSIYYQARVARHWCVLCCIVQFLLWCEFLTLNTFLSPLFLPLTYSEWATLIVCFMLPVISWALLKPLILTAKQLKPLKNQLRRFKYNTELFNTLLTSQPKYALPSENWSIVLGNLEADNSITIVTNPYCAPCANMHKLVDNILNERDDIQARIIFATDNVLTDIKTPVSRHFMALNALNDKRIVKEALSDWYGKNEKNYESWAKMYPVDLVDKEFIKLDKQRAWCEMAEITGTPALFLNGYRLPDLYELPDLKYILG
jgi:uncharacterized membrane protein